MDRMLLLANRIVNCSDLYPYTLRQKAWDYEKAADRRILADRNLAMVKSVLAEAPEYFHTQLREALSEETQAGAIFLKTVGPWLTPFNAFLPF